MKRKIAIVTGSRAEYGLLYWIMKEIQKSRNLELQLIVTGMHLSDDFGASYKQILDDGFIINKEVDIRVEDDTPQGITKSIGLGLIGFAQAYEELKPDILLVLGDRYEILAAVSAALPFNIPIAHISGGEITEGAIDEQIRHAITKMSHIHFPGAEIYRDNIIKMGEQKWRVFYVGDPAIENIFHTKFFDRKLLFSELGLDINLKTFLVTLHPVTSNSKDQIEAESKFFFDTLSKYKNVNIVITYPNSDQYNSIIVNQVKDFCLYNSNAKAFKNLGSQYYLSVMKACDVVLGNSSSAIAEAPVLKKPVIDYGDRQKGRLKADNIITVEVCTSELQTAIDKCLNDTSFLKQVEKTESLYGNGETSKLIVKILSSIFIDQRLLRKKLVFDQL